MNKISIRFFDDKEVRAVWDDEDSKWWFSVVDIVGVLSRSTDSRNYRYVLKNRLKKAGSEVLTNCKGFKLMAPDGKLHMTDCLTDDGVIMLADEIADKYVEMNVAHPFMEGNGRSARIWLDLILKKNLKFCVDWSLINKKDYLFAMERSVASSTQIKALIQAALTDKINDREVFMKGVDYSYYYEQEDVITEDGEE